MCTLDKLDDAGTALCPAAARRAGAPLSPRASVALDAQPEAVLLVNNFDSAPQQEAPAQPDAYVPALYAGVFDPHICAPAASDPAAAPTSEPASTRAPLALVDNRYSNGADRGFVRYLLNATSACGRNISDFAYAGWNTDGACVLPRRRGERDRCCHTRAAAGCRRGSMRVRVRSRRPVVATTRR